MMNKVMALFDLILSSKGHDKRELRTTLAVLSRGMSRLAILYIYGEFPPLLSPIFLKYHNYLS